MTSLEIWTLAISVITALCAIGGLIWTINMSRIEGLRARRLKGIDHLLRYSRDFDTENFRKKRYAAAKHLLNQNRESSEIIPTELLTSPVEYTQILKRELDHGRQ